MMKKNTRLLIAIVLLVVSIWKTEFSTSEVKSAVTEATDTHTVTRVVDGDTIEIDGTTKVRYIGMDTPESTNTKECFGKEASNKNKELVLNKQVTLEKDVSETDRYGRLLRYVWIDGTMINEKLVADGYANAASYPPDVKYQDRLRNAEAAARNSNLGLWSSCR
jgi:micrococcal nuclease